MNDHQPAGSPPRKRRGQSFHAPTGLQDDPILHALPIVVAALLAIVSPLAGFVVLVLLFLLAVGSAIRLPALPTRAELGERVGPSRLLLTLLLVLGGSVALVAPTVGVAALVVVGAFLVLRIGTIPLPVFLGLWAVALFAVPAAYKFGPFSFTAANAVAALVLLSWAGGKLLPYVDLARGYNQVVVVLVFFGLVTLLGYAELTIEAASAGQVKDANRTMAAFVLGIAVALAIADGIRSTSGLRRFLGLALFGAAVMAIVGLIQFQLEIDPSKWLKPPGFRIDGSLANIAERAGFTRVPGTAEHPIEFGVVAACMLPVGLHFVHYASTYARRNFALIVTLMLAVCIPLSLSRSAVVAGAAALFVAGVAWSGLRRIRVIVLGLVFAGLLTLVVPGLLGAIGDLLQGEEGVGSLQTRADRRAYALEISRDTLWMGKGLGWYQTVDHPDVGVLDNAWFTMLVEQGLLGIVAFLALIGFGLLEALRVRRRGPPVEGDLAMALAGGAIGLAVSGWGLAFQAYPTALGSLFLFLGSIACLGRQVDARAAGAAAGGSRPQEPLAASRS